MFGLSVDTLNGVQYNSFNVMGIDNSGQLLWTKKYGNSKFQYLDNFYELNWIFKKGSYLYHAGVALDSNNKYLGVLIKFDFNGDTIWQSKYYDAAYDVIPFRVTASVDNGFLITGFFQKPSDQPLMLLKTNSNGKELWRKYLHKTGNDGQEGRAIVQDTATKKIVITGWQYIGNTISDNLSICDSLGNNVSCYGYTSSLGGWFQDMMQTKDKGIVAVGINLKPQLIQGYNASQSYIVKVDLNSPMTPLWKKDNFDMVAFGNSFLGVRELPDETMLLSGSIDTMQQHNLPLQGLHRFTKISKSGNVIFNRHYNYSLNTNIDNNMCYMSFNIASNGDWLAPIYVGNQGVNPYFFVRYDSTGCDSSTYYCATVVVKKNYLEDQKIKLFPNPASSHFSIYVGGNCGSKTIKISDVSGRILKVLEFNSENFDIDVDDLSAGTYFVEVYENKTLIALEKLLKE